MSLNPVNYIKSMFNTKSFKDEVQASMGTLIKNRQYYRDLVVKADLEVSVLTAKIKVLETWLYRHSDSDSG